MLEVLSLDCGQTIATFDRGENEDVQGTDLAMLSNVLQVLFETYPTCCCHYMLIESPSPADLQTILISFMIYGPTAFQCPNGDRIVVKSTPLREAKSAYSSSLHPSKPRCDLIMMGIRCVQCGQQNRKKNTQIRRNGYH
jgi:hypothetical protein